LPKKKEKLKKLQRRLCRSAFLHLERQVLRSRDPFENGKLISMIDKLCLRLLAVTLGIPRKKVTDKSELNSFIYKARKTMRKDYKK